jgi:hypothetical protein
VLYQARLYDVNIKALLRLGGYIIDDSTTYLIYNNALIVSCMPIPEFNPEDWVKISEYREKMYQWAHSPEGEKTSIALDLGSANIVTAIAFLRAQESSEKLAIEVAKSQKTLENFTLLLFFLTTALVASLMYTIGSLATITTIFGAGILTVILILCWKVGQKKV